MTPEQAGTLMSMLPLFLVVALIECVVLNVGLGILVGKALRP